MRTIGVVTVGRSDYGIYLPILRRMQADSALKPWVFASGTHLSADFGMTVRDIEKDGFEVRERVDLELVSDTPEGIAHSMGVGVVGFAAAYERSRPDILVVLGDRFDMFAAVAAALPFKIPVAHLHGGELTRGAIDDALRHAITKMSHLHFVATEDYAHRVMQLGEEPRRVMVSGAPSLDNLRAMKLFTAEEMERLVGLPMDPAPLLVTLHPVTLEYEKAAWHAEELLAALAAVDRPLVFTGTNADTGGRSIRRLIDDFVGRRANARFVENLGTCAYFSLMKHAAAMVGNSSSGMIEAASFELPVVNIGLRQDGRVRDANIIDVGHGRAEIAAGVAKALTPTFRSSLRGMKNPCGDGHASEKIVERLKTVTLDNDLVMKRFVDAKSMGG
ncbi:MAG TPA: UDP-N-acetylglucosamine 2-epimerase [Kiritimatiellia bacterium]|nr:UDP-N-acetylglucosamine 2-epimerase [Kiritimatiellia bacterium]